MTQPLTVRIDRALSNFSLAYMQGQDQYIAPRVFPRINADVQGGKYWVFNKADWFRDQAQIRPPATESAGGGFNLSTDTFYADVFAWHQDLSDQQLANADTALNIEQAAARFVMNTILMKMESTFVSTFMAASVWGTTTTPANLWSSYTTSTPFTDVETGRLTIQGQTGMKPNTLVVGAQVHSALINHPDFIERVKYTSDRVIDNADVARYFGVERYFVANAIQNTANEGATAAYSFVHGKDALLVYAETSPAWGSATGGAMLTWDDVSDKGGADGVGTVRIEMPLKRAVRIESQYAWDYKVVASDLGYFFDNVVS